jgi:hypothetical protein
MTRASRLRRRLAKRCHSVQSTSAGRPPHILDPHFWTTPLAGRVSRGTKLALSRGRVGPAKPGLVQRRTRHKRAREDGPPLGPSPPMRRSPTPPQTSGEHSVVRARRTPPVMVPPASASSPPSSSSFEKAAAVAAPNRPEDKQMASASASVEERPCSTSPRHRTRRPASSRDGRSYA